MISRRNKIREVEVTLAAKKERPFRVKRASQPGKLVAEILRARLGEEK